MRQRRLTDPRLQTNDYKNCAMAVKLRPSPVRSSEGKHEAPQAPHRQ